ncbi:MlaD family protein [Nocardia sp. NBC_00565]|uniref:MlaD family protein n=1 Tax=Nocardia sp. NBC_00565 TaxID=2975993 RepID=UPI002E7FD159|nr:MlaD family protein [Nocardia sp. NBC_00565]WUC05566.1 MlaD family protein [Nocardia sp. NBC_00565]
MQRGVSIPGQPVRARIGPILRRLAANELLLGLSVVAVVTVIVAATVGFYLYPPGRTELSFETTDAAAVRTGDDVRVAGVSVGKVTGIALGRNSVRVTADIDEGTFVGSASRVEVRMLTAVGGYFVTIIPMGDKPLGRTVLPVDRVTMPYSISDVLQEVPRVTDNVDASTVNADLDQLANGLEHNSAAVGSLIAGLNSIARVMADQRQQIQTTLDLASEYATAFNGSREFVFELAQKIDVVMTTYATYRDGFNRTYQLLGGVMMRLRPETEYFLAHKEELRSVVEQLRTGIENLRQAVDPAIGQLTQLRDQLTGWLTPQGVAEMGGGRILASQVCVPIPGREC